MPFRPFILVLMLLSATLPALAQDEGESRRRERRPAIDPTTLEVEPITRVIADADRDTVPDRRGQPVRVRGVVVVGTGTLRTHGMQVVVQDDTGGIGLYNRDSSQALVAGDLVEAWGEVSQYRGAVQLQRAGVRRMGKAPLPQVRAITVAEADSWAYMGQRVRIEGIAGELALDSYGTLRITGDEGAMVSVFVPTVLTDKLDWKQFPRGTRVSATGVLSIYKTTWPYDGGFQVILSDPADLAVLEPAVPAWRQWLAWGLLGVLALVAAGVLTVHLLNRRQRAREQELKTLAALSAALANTDAGEAHLARNASEILTAYGIADAVMVQVFDERSCLRQLAVSTADPALGTALQASEAVCTTERSGAAPTSQMEAKAAEQGLSLLAVHPMVGSSGPMGFLLALSPRKSRPSQMQERTLLSAVKLLAMALENGRMQQRARQEQQELQQLVITDELTRLYNRRFLDEYLRVQIPLAQRRGGGLAFLALDIDHFKRINDTYGHDAGDRVLAGVAAQLRGASRSCDLPVRLGGEEFVFVIAEHDVDGAMAFAERLRTAIGAQAHDAAAPGHSIRVTVSIGVAMFGIHGSTAACLLRASDEAMYASKRAGRDRVTLSTQIETSGA
jgi:diguanylate cyclase (GGDEF)-like protein